MKILNLYAGIGGNRKLWDHKHDITAVEIDSDIAKVYQDLFPRDNVIIDDAHEFLRQHFREYDFIWASPPCPTHSVLQMTRYYSNDLRYPDLLIKFSITKSNQILNINCYTIDEYVDYLTIDRYGNPKKGGFGTGLGWTYATGSKGEKIQFKG